VHQQFNKPLPLNCCQAVLAAIERGEIGDYAGEWCVIAGDGLFRIVLEVCPFCGAKIPRLAFNQTA
jgi:hypothetical protein